ncbi:MAG: ornithine cyclodeaminase [Lachnospiraceae bacterium]|nr:ornithine cyclodeaminase [Lachnospiraceae bacterium]
MKVVSFNDIINLGIAPETCFDWADEMIRNKDKALLPAKISIKPSAGVFCNVMPCILEKSGGVKVVTRYPERKPSLDSKLLLFDSESGEFLALMDANWITAMRTGAVAAHSIMLFSKKNFSVLGLLGLGNTSRAALIILASMMPEKEFTVKLLKYKGQEEAFIERFSAYTNLHFVCVDSADVLVKGSDVVVSGATYLPEDLCADACFDPGVLVIPIHTLGFTNCDLFFDKVFADDRGHVQHFKNFDKFKCFAEVSAVVNGKAVGRESDEERIIAYNIGVAMHDINFATHIYRLVENSSDLADINLNEPTEKFWI